MLPQRARQMQQWKAPPQQLLPQQATQRRRHRAAVRLYLQQVQQPQGHRAANRLGQPQGVLKDRHIERPQGMSSASLTCLLLLLVLKTQYPLPEKQRVGCIS